MRADVDCGFTEAKTAYGLIGVKVIIFHGEVLPGRKEAAK
jgi:small subunit ribosomal protein S3